MPFRLALTLSILLLPHLSAAQPATTQSTGADLSIYLMTMGPGAEIYERFGHNAIYVVDHRLKESYAFNYGVFDFDEPGFLSRFIEGKMMYWMEAYYGDKAIQSYKDQDRAIWMQELNLTDAQKIRLVKLLSQQQKQKYLYNYYTANCSTKVRDVLDQALGGQLKPQLQKIPTPTTYRWHSQRISAYSLPIYTCMYFILGQNVDKPIDAWDESFLPLKMMEHLKTVTITNGTLPPTPLIKSTEQIYKSTKFTDRAEPPNWTLYFLLTGLLYGAVLIALTHLSLSSIHYPRSSRYLFALLSFLWSLLAAFAGCFLSWAFTTDHWSVYWNENIFQLTPLSVPLIVLAPAAIFHKRWALRPALFFSFAALLTSVLGFILQLLPGFYQVNGPIIALSLPIHLGLALSIYLLYRRNPPAAAMTPNPAPKPKLHGAAMKAASITLFISLLASGCAGPAGPSAPPPAKRSSEPAIPPPPPRAHVPINETFRESARAEIYAALNSEDPVIRTHAIEAAREALASAARPQILKALEDKQGIVRYAAAMATGELRLDGARATLIKMINDPDQGAQVGAIFALHRLGDVRFSAGLESALRSPELNVRATAAFALGRLGEKSAINILRSCLKDRAIEVRLQSAEALWRLGDEDGLKTLVAASLSGHPAHAMVALLALAAPGDVRLIEHIRAGLESDYLEVKLVAARALGQPFQLSSTLGS